MSAKNAVVNPVMNKSDEEVASMKKELVEKKVVYGLEGTEVRDAIYHASHLLECDIDVRDNWILYEDFDVTYGEFGSAEVTLTIYTDASSDEFEMAETVETVQ